MKQTRTLDNRNIVDYFCDDCKEKTPYEVKCTICKKDICYRCWGYFFQNNSDSPPKYCKRCFTIGKEQKYFEAIQEINEKSKDLVSKIMTTWKAVSIGQQNSNDNNGL